LPRNISRSRKCILAALVLSIIVLFLTCPVIHAAEKQPRSIRVVMDNNYPPYTFLDKRGKLQGVLVDQWALWEKKTGIKVELFGMDWASALGHMEEGAFDVIDTIFFNEKRAKIFDFTKPYEEIEVPIFFHQNISGITDAWSLRDFAVAVKKGDAAVDFLKARGVSNLIEYTSYEAIINAASDLRVGVFVVDKPPALYYLYREGIYGQFKYSRPLYVGAFHRAVMKGNSALLATVEQGFASITAEEYRAIERKWHGSREFPTHYLRNAGIAAALIAALLLGLAIWNRALRRAVRRKTAELKKEMRLSEERAEALRESEERFALFLEHCPILVFLKDEDNRAVALSRSFERLLEKPLREILGKTSEELFPPELARSIRADDEEVLRTGRLKTVEESFEGRSYITCKFPLHRPDKAALLGGFTIEITDRKRFEEALKKSEQQYRDVVNNANSIILRWDGAGNILFMNPYGLEFFGYGEEELIGRNVVGTIVPELESASSRDLVSLMEEIQQNPDAFKSNENENIKKNGERVWISWTNKAVMNENGECVEILSIGKDMTEKKLLEAQFLQAQKMEAVGTLAGGIAHDFNNLLMGIMGYTSVMLLTMEPTDPSYDKLRSIEDQIKSGAELTKQLLGFARGGKYEVKPTDLGNLIKRCVDMFGHANREITIHEEFSEDLCTTEVDRSQMEQVFLNLFVNASQAMPLGGQLFVDARNVSFHDTRVVPKEGLYARISVTDTGVGMDEATKARIFDPFFTTKDLGTGSGLGLASAYGIIKNHQGAITVDSKLGKGTRFNIYIPASQKPVREEKPAAAEVVRGAGTVLLVEDQPAVAETAQEMLKALGYDVHVAGSGGEALTLFARHKGSVNLVILDMIMPGLSGSETYDRLKEIDPNIKVILCSGYSIEGQAAKILERGCNSFIQKPFTVTELSEKLMEVLGKT
jgi:PAS domain S-box-containing protein